MSSTGASSSMPIAAWRDCAPAAVPRVHDVLAIPLPFVVELVGLALPSPTSGVQLTDTPDTGLPKASVTSTWSTLDSGCPTVAL